MSKLYPRTTQIMPPLTKCSFPLSRQAWEEKHDMFIQSALEVLCLALYDVSSPIDMTTKAQLSYRSAESYTWYALAAYYTKKSRNDWTSGRARKLGSRDDYVKDIGETVA